MESCAVDKHQCFIWIMLFRLSPLRLLLLLFTQSCPTLCDPMDCSTPSFAVLHYLLEFAQTHVHWVDDAIQPSHPLLRFSHPVLNLSQHQGLFQWVSSPHQVAKELELQLQHQSFQWTTQDSSPLGWTGWISLQSKGLLRVFPNTKVIKFHK